MRAAVLWTTANALPFAVVLAVRSMAPEPFGYAGVVFAAFIVFVAAGQAYALNDRRWFARTAIGLALALAVAAIVLGIADMGGAERAGIALAHIAGGCALVLVQRRRAPERWTVPALAAWIVLPVLLALTGWHAGGGLSLFAGYRELANFTILLAGYGLATAPAVASQYSWKPSSGSVRVLPRR